jgi:broad specificity phosphatase PhoE
MKTYYLFRHGLTLAVKRKRWYWNTLWSAQIIDEGKPSLERLAAYMKDIKADYYVTSPFLRCRQTAAYVEKVTGKKFVIDKRVGEYVFELPWRVTDRFRRFITEMEKSDNDTIVICTHSIGIEMLLPYLTKGRMDFFHRVIAPQTGVLTIVKDKVVQSINFNESPTPVKK